MPATLPVVALAMTLLDVVEIRLGTGAKDAAILVGFGHEGDIARHAGMAESGNAGQGLRG